MAFYKHIFILSLVLALPLKHGNEASSSPHFGCNSGIDKANNPNFGQALKLNATIAKHPKSLSTFLAHQRIRVPCLPTLQKATLPAITKGLIKIAVTNKFAKHICMHF